MAKARKIWMLAPPKQKQVEVPDALRSEVEAKKLSSANFCKARCVND